ncbi:MAG: cytochrome c [Proteobacteria bacterium]|nr:cytochrome c [Pseudomonadota bacterium]MCP4919399.1 cytochrome c [Pseudomonadota bacterium]
MLIALIACNAGTGGYDPDTWNSPLASEAEEDGDPVNGETIYFEETWNGSAYGLTCSHCHSIDPADTPTTDADEYNRAAHTVWNAPYRASWKSGDAWDSDSNKIGAFGGQICVVAYYPDSEMDAQSAADLEAWMRQQRDDVQDADDDRAQPLEYGFTSWDADAWLEANPAPYGDAVAGQELTDRHCGSCHGEPAVFYSLDSLDDATLVSRIRKDALYVDTDQEVDAPNGDMPRLPKDRLSDDELGDLLAYLTQDAGE